LSTADFVGRQAPAFGIYVHWPFCLSKCPYCDFNSHVRNAPLDEARFLRGFETEIRHTAERLPGRAVSTVFFGGGTPSLMAPATAAAILDAIARHWSIEPEVEVTLEANPTSVEAGRLRAYRSAGVNRVSLGVQSFDDRALRQLGRLHSADEAMAALAVARRTFDRVSFDLIYARPQQTPAAWRDELQRALNEAAEHLSLYQLTIETDTPFAKLHALGKLSVPDADAARALYELTQEITSARGLPAYEVSNHAAPGAECRHNLIYWRYGEYAGVGPGAHGRNLIDGVRRATATERHPERWLMRVESLGHGIVADDALTPEQEGDEMLLMGLRLAEGVDPQRFAEIRGRPLDPQRIAALCEHGLLDVEAGARLRITSAGFPVLDAVVADLAA
jgi:putative oxygen-independent coproporphyrinogen III oxidase